MIFRSTDIDGVRIVEPELIEDDTEIFYEMAGTYQAGSSRGARWDDPTPAVDWPLVEPILSSRDRALPIPEAATC